MHPRVHASTHVVVVYTRAYCLAAHILNYAQKDFLRDGASEMKETFIKRT